MDQPLTVDADGHVLEPRTTWLDYIDPPFRERAMRIVDDDRGDEVLLVDGRPLESMRNGLAGMGGIELDRATVVERRERLRYEDGCPPGGYDPAARLEVMDAEGIDVALLYPTLSLCWEGIVTDPALATAYTRAYNRYIVDFCGHDPSRLVPVAHISLIDEARAVEEVTRARAAGCRAVYLSPDPPARANRSLTDPAFDRFWSTLEDLDLPVGFHVVVRDRPELPSRIADRTRGGALFNFAFLGIGVMAAFTEMLAGGVLDRHPRLRVAVLETGATWIAAWLDRLDHKFEVMRRITPITMRPSEYFSRQCLVSADPDETVIASIVEAIGADHFVWASDYPHIDAGLGVVDEIRSRLAPLAEDDRAKVLGANAARFYGLDGREGRRPRAT